jgi:ADP-ribose pyrophosphatase YjhB (NUDIX family)
MSTPGDATARIRIHRFCPRCGAESMSVRTPQLVVCGACDLHLYYNPCAATAGILLDASDRVLLVRRARNPAKGKLAFPGGFVDDHESAEDGLRRELREETGLDVGPLEFLVTHPNTYPYRDVIYPTLDIFFVARVDDFEKARPLDGVDGIVVCATDEVCLDDLAFDSMKAAWTAFLTKRNRPKP